MNTQQIIDQFLALPVSQQHYILGYVIVGDKEAWQAAFAALDAYNRNALSDPSGKV
jgi:hypothetical protein